jgi:hypothetical protein
MTQFFMRDRRFLVFEALSKAWLDSVNAPIGKVFGRGLMYYMAYFVSEMHRSFMLNNL